MTDLYTFDQYNKLADMLIEQATKEQLAECARLLSLNLAHHQSLHGEIPLDETLTMLDATMPNAAQAKLLTDGMVNLIGMLGNVCSGLAACRTFLHQRQASETILYRRIAGQTDVTIHHCRPQDRLSDAAIGGGLAQPRSSGAVHC